MSSRIESALEAIIESDESLIEEPARSRVETLLIQLFNKIESLEAGSTEDISELTTTVSNNTNGITAINTKLLNIIQTVSATQTFSVTSNGYVSIPLTIPEGYERLHNIPIAFISGSTIVRMTGDSTYSDGAVSIFLAVPSSANVTITVEYICIKTDI